MRLANRSKVDPFIVMDVMEAARRAEEAGRRIIHMEVGQPGTPAPAGARAALARAMEEAPMGYTVALGLPSLRARIARLYGEWYDLDLDPGRVVITAGASGAFILAFTALFDAGARVGIGAPGYPSYRQILRALDLVPVDIETAPAHRLQPAPEDLAGRDLAGLLVASPANPSGTMLGRAALGALIGATQEAGAQFISDEIYHGIEYEAKAVSALEISDEAYVVNSFSKYFSMTGWRVGWMVVPESPCPHHRAAGAEPLHLRAACQPGRGARRDGLHRRARGEPRGLCPQSRADARGAAEGRVRPDRAARRGVLRLCRCQPPHR